MSDEFKVFHDGQQFGPHSQDEILVMLNSGMINGHAQVWCEGWEEWQQVSTAFPSTHPPALVPTARSATKRTKSATSPTGFLIAAIGAGVCVLGGLVALYDGIYNGNFPMFMCAAGLYFCGKGIAIFGFGLLAAAKLRAK